MYHTALVKTNFHRYTLICMHSPAGALPATLAQGGYWFVTMYNTYFVGEYHRNCGFVHRPLRGICICMFMYLATP